MSQQPSGWYDDPANPQNIRYWDGAAWTNHTSPKAAAAPAPSAQPPASPPQSAPTSPGPQDGSGAASPWGGVPQSSQQGAPVTGATSGPAAPGAPAPGAYPYGAAPTATDWMSAQPTTADGVPLATWGRRFAAWLIDGVILGVLVVLLTQLFVPEYRQALADILNSASAGEATDLQTTLDKITPYALRAGLVQVLTALVYCVLFWTTTGQTPGKMVTGISVRRADRPGPLDLATAVRRRLISFLSLVPFLSSVAGLVTLLDGLWPLWDDKKQALHDKVAGTQVVVGKQPRTKG